MKVRSVFLTIFHIMSFTRYQMLVISKVMHYHRMLNVQGLDVPHSDRATAKKCQLCVIICSKMLGIGCDYSPLLKSAGESVHVSFWPPRDVFVDPHIHTAYLYFVLIYIV